MFSGIKIKIIFYLLILVALGFLVDFSNLSLKTVIPEKVESVVINKGINAGTISNLEEISVEEKNNFEGDNQKIINLANEARIQEGLESLKENELLRLSAMEKAQHMKDNGYFDHVSPNGVQPWYFAQKQNYNYKAFGENLAEGYFSAESVHEGWMNSPGHRENILSEKFEEIGVAILEFQQEGQKSYLIVQHFGSLLKPEDLITEIVCDKKSEDNCEDAEDEEEEIEKLIKEQKKIIKEAITAGVGSKDLNRLEENLDDLQDAEEELEDYIEECEEFIKKCDVFK